MDRVQILTTCKVCKGKAFFPTEEEIFIGGWKYYRHKPCNTCHGSGRQIIWIDLSELARLLDEIRNDRPPHKGIL